MSDSKKLLQNTEIKDENKENGMKNHQDEELINCLTAIAGNDLSVNETEEYMTSDEFIFENIDKDSEEEQDASSDDQSPRKRRKRKIEKRKCSNYDIFNEKTDISKCVKLIEKLIIDIKQKSSEIKWKNAERKFEKWNNYSKKHLKDHFFCDKLFRAVYLLNLYWRRMESFYHLLEKFGKNKQHIAKLRNCKSIFSFGCGAAPEIAAFLHFYKVKLGYRNYNNLSTIKGVDTIKDWECYISVIEDVFKINFLFKNEDINENFMLNFENVDLLMMSYSYESKYGNIWNDLKNKCKIIIIMHENEELFQKLDDYGYKSCTFSDGRYGNKTFYYFLRED